MAKFDNIGVAHMGNGLTIYDRSQMEHGDYKTIANIDNWRNVQFYGTVSDEIKEHIFSIARTDNSAISATQSNKIFQIKPNDQFTYRLECKVYRVKILQYVENGGKKFLVGSIYAEDKKLHELSCNGFDSYQHAVDTASEYGYQIYQPNY